MSEAKAAVSSIEYDASLQQFGPTSLTLLSLFRSLVQFSPVPSSSFCLCVCVNIIHKFSPVHKPQCVRQQQYDKSHFNDEENLVQLVLYGLPPLSRLASSQQRERQRERERES